MRFYVSYDKLGYLENFMVYDGVNESMTEVTETEYQQILAENGICYTVESSPTMEDITLDMLADHEERLCMLELTTL